MSRILAVDDEPHILKLVSFSLRSGGFDVVEAADGLSAIDIAAAEQPDLILMDVMMPALDGYELIKRVKTHPEWNDIPLVIMTAYPIDRSRIDLLDLTAGLISKPLSPTQIAGMVDELLSGRFAHGADLDADAAAGGAATAKEGGA